MSERLTVDESSELKLGRGVRLQFDNNRQSWSLMAPERVFFLDEISHEVVVEITAKLQPLSGVIDTLAGRFQAPREEIAGDVVEMVQALTDKKLLVADE